MKLEPFDLIPIKPSELLKTATKTNNAFQQFVLKNVDLTFYYLNISAHDYYAASRIARRKIQRAMDWLFVGSDEDIFSIHSKCFVVGAIKPQKAKIQSLAYKLDGHFKADEATYKVFLDRYKQLDPNQVSGTTLEKISSTLRYLRLGSLAHEEENKLLNYWIAMEYLFTTGNADENKTEKMKDYFSKIHSISYIRRQFVDLHKSIIRLNLQPSIRQFAPDNIDYLLHAETLADISAVANRYPLLFFRHSTLINRYRAKQGIENDITRHKNNVICNITRIYRSRNEIVHRAATELELIDLAGHLKYYLVFTLNALLDFLLNYPLDVDGDAKITIDDFYSLSCIEHDALFSRGALSIQDMLAIRNPVEYLQN